MKRKISITVDDENVQKIDKLVKDNNFRNRSHAIEVAIIKLLSSIIIKDVTDIAKRNERKII